MKATHRYKHGPKDRVFSLDGASRIVWVKIDGQPWNISSWSGQLVLFHKVVEKINTFKGNK